MIQRNAGSILPWGKTMHQSNNDRIAVLFGRVQASGLHRLGDLRDEGHVHDLLHGSMTFRNVDDASWM